MRRSVVAGSSLGLLFLSFAAVANPEMILACTNGDHEACGTIGAMYSQGIDIERDTEKAEYYLNIACANEHIISCHNLGLVQFEYLNKPYLAIDSYDKSCNGGFAPSCWNVGLIYYNGVDNKPDRLLAVEYFKKACSLESAFTLGEKCKGL